MPRYEILLIYCCQQSAAQIIDSSQAFQESQQNPSPSGHNLGIRFSQSDNLLEILGHTDRQSNDYTKLKTGQSRQTFSGAHNDDDDSDEYQDDGDDDDDQNK